MHKIASVRLDALDGTITGWDSLWDLLSKEDEEINQKKDRIEKQFNKDVGGFFDKIKPGDFVIEEVSQSELESSTDATV